MELKDFRSGIKTTEFMRCWLLLGTVFIFHKKFNLGLSLPIGICLLASAYAISRGLHKRNRATLIGRGERTSEFFVTAAGSLIILIGALSGQAPIDLSVVCIAIIEASYFISRGQAKSLTSQSAKVYNLG